MCIMAKQRLPQSRPRTCSNLVQMKRWQRQLEADQTGHVAEILVNTITIKIIMLCVLVLIFLLISVDALVLVVVMLGGVGRC